MARKSNKILALILASGAFFAVGLLIAMLGPVLPDLARNTGSSLGELGSLFTSLFLGALLAQVLLGPINDRVGPRPIVFVGLLLTAVGLLGTSLSTTLPMSLGSMFVAGLGDGALLVSINVMLTLVFASRSVTALNLSNVFYAVGAVSGPALASMVSGIWGSALPAMWIASGVLVLLVFLALFVAMPRTQQAAQDAHGIAETTTHNPVPAAQMKSIYRTPLLWTFAAILLVYVGIEAGLGNWSISYLDRAGGLSAETAALTASGFWLALMGGRLLGAFAGAKIGPVNLLVISFAGAFLSALLLQFSAGNGALMVAAILLIGAFFGPVYSTVVALTGTTFRASAGRALSLVMAMGSVGGMLIPWVQGALLDWVGPYTSMLVVVFAPLAMLILHAGPAVMGRLVRGGAPAATPSGSSL